MLLSVGSYLVGRSFLSVLTQTYKDLKNEKSIPLQVVMPFRKVDVCFVEDSSPLEWCRVLCLTRCTVTQLAFQRCVPGQLILHLAAVTARFIFDVEPAVRIMDTIRRFLLPGVLAACAAALLVLCWMITTVRLCSSFTVRSLVMCHLAFGRHAGEETGGGFEDVRRCSGEVKTTTVSIRKKILMTE